MEEYLTIEELAKHLKLSEVTIRKWVVNKQIPYCKIKKVIRFRLSVIEQWVDSGGLCDPEKDCINLETDLFTENETNTAEPV